MSYQVLARKWRPRSFREMVGQEHVLKALINALDHNRLHHAYLFTGTRGVGKTTIARILAKCLNCDIGISSEPCGECSSCREIAEGRFVDLIEVDAASRTKVEDTRELLDNVQYAPSRGRFKIYLIDEVHMLSNHSFNALLKTLEEPPDHVKFLLATTDPQKLPVTILSRCLQFNLKNMSPERIVNHLQFVLQEELVPFDDAAIWQLARSADGSMRDALSLTDQAIAYGNGLIDDADVSAMLGAVDHRFVARLIDALVNVNAADLLAAVADFAEQAPDYHSALADLITLLHRIAIAQALPDALDNSYGDREKILEFAHSMASEDVQLFYQTALIGRRDLHLVPDARAGFEMTLLRMLVFKPQGVADVPTSTLPANPPGAAPAHQDPSAKPQRELARHNVGETAPIEMPDPEGPATPVVPVVEAVSQNVPEVDVNREDPSVKKSEAVDRVRSQLAELGVAVQTASQLAPKEQPGEPVIAESTPAAITSLNLCQPEHWIGLYQALQVRGVLQSTVANCVMLGRKDNHFYFALDEGKASLYDDSHSQRLSDLMSDYFAESINVHIELRPLSSDVETPAMHQERLKAEARAKAIDRLCSDPLMQVLQRDFSAHLDRESVTFTVGSSPEIALER